MPQKGAKFERKHRFQPSIIWRKGERKKIDYQEKTVITTILNIFQVNIYQAIERVNIY